MQLAKHLESLVRASFLAEINALKPGNVHRYAAGHDMSYADFEKSAEICSPILCDPSLRFGERIYRSVSVTQEQVGCNTNLGMILLFTPLILAAEGSAVSAADGSRLRQSLRDVLENTTDDDAQQVYRAIRFANPGGLGNCDVYDVTDSPQVGLLEAMNIAKHRDRIALQYSTGFVDIFDSGVKWIEQSMLRWNRLDWAVVLCYLNFLSQYCDSHIARKFGDECAERIRKNTIELAQRFNEQTEPEAMRQDLLQYDSDLKAANINPGTTADLTAASVLLYSLVENSL